MNGEPTGFTDKNSKPIHYGDIIQIGLGKSDRQNKLVIRSGKHTKLVNETDSYDSTGGYVFTEKMCKWSVVLERYIARLPNAD